MSAWLLEIARWLLVVIGGGAIAYGRFAGIDLTEGRNLQEYWPFYLAGALCLGLAAIYRKHEARR